MYIRRADAATDASIDERLGRRGVGLPRRRGAVAICSLYCILVYGFSYVRMYTEISYIRLLTGH